MTALQAHHHIVPHLEKVPLSEVCSDFVDGFCPNRDACSESHKVVRIQEHSSTKRTEHLPSVPNFLSLEPRVAPQDGVMFDEDGPGSLSSAGARHDNDFESIKDIKILPTTDEVFPILCTSPGRC